MEVSAIFAGALLTATLLVIEHVTLWEHRQRIKRPVAYAIGTLSIAAGIALTSALTDQWMYLIVYLATLLPGGGLIVAAYLIRSEQPTPADELREEQHGTLPGARWHRRN